MSVSLTDAPEFDGGAMIAQYEVSMFNPDGSSRIAYVGRDKECLVASLLPGRSYSFQVRASNRVGVMLPFFIINIVGLLFLETNNVVVVQFGPWSELFETLSGASVPEAPAELMLNGRSSHSVIVGWNEPPNNGASITEFRLEMSTGDKKSSPLMSNTQMNVANEGSEENLPFTSIYCGLGLIFEVKGLLPVTSYYFRIQVYILGHFLNSKTAQVYIWTVLGCQQRWCWRLFSGQFLYHISVLAIRRIWIAMCQN